MERSELRALLDARGLRLRSELGQNFLTSDARAEQLVQQAGVEPSDCVIEIGTGLGVLTRALAARAHEVISIEIDAGLVRALREESLLPGNVELLHEDALDRDLAALAMARGQGRPLRLVANLPYSSATPLLRRMLDWRDVFVDWSVMVQRELAARITSQCGEKDYGSLAALHHLCADVEAADELAPDAFFPVPRVRSAFVRVRPHRSGPGLVSAEELPQLERTLRAAFGQRRKQLANALRGAGHWSAEEIAAALGSVGIDRTRRAESLEPEVLLALARALAKPDAVER